MLCGGLRNGNFGSRDDGRCLKLEEGLWVEYWEIWRFEDWGYGSRVGRWRIVESGSLASIVGAGNECADCWAGTVAVIVAPNMVLDRYVISRRL